MAGSTIRPKLLTAVELTSITSRVTDHINRTANDQPDRAYDLPESQRDRLLLLRHIAALDAVRAVAPTPPDARNAEGERIALAHLRDALAMVEGGQAEPDQGWESWLFDAITLAEVGSTETGARPETVTVTPTLTDEFSAHVKAVPNNGYGRFVELEIEGDAHANLFLLDDEARAIAGALLRASEWAEQFDPTRHGDGAPEQDGGAYDVVPTGSCSPDGGERQ